MPVRVYTDHSCRWCEEAKKFLTKHSVDFEEISIEEPEGLAKLLEITGSVSLVPVIEIGDQIIEGFDENKLRKALELS